MPSEQKSGESTDNPLLTYLRGAVVVAVFAQVAWLVSRMTVVGLPAVGPILPEILFFGLVAIPVGLVASAIGGVVCSWKSCSRLTLGNALSGVAFGGSILLVESMALRIVIQQPLTLLLTLAFAFLVCCLVHPGIALPFLNRRAILVFYAIPAAIAVASVGLYRAATFARESLQSQDASLSAGAQSPPISAVNLITATEDEIVFDGKLTVVEFWRTSCEPCQDAMEKLDAFAAANVDRSNGALQVVTISLDVDDDAAREHLKTRQWLNSHALIDKPVAADSSTGFSFALARRFGVQAIPHCLLIDDRSRIVYQGHPMYLDLGAIIEHLPK